MAERKEALVRVVKRYASLDSVDGRKNRSQTLRSILGFPRGKQSVG